MEVNYSDKIHDIAVSTMEITCYMFPLEEWELEDRMLTGNPEGKVRSIVKFDGAAEGGMVINPSDELLDAMAANMLGMENADDEQKEGALCEITNIICGNTVPLFAHNKHICYIRPPRIAEPEEDLDQIFHGMKKEVIPVYLDEGVAEIIIYYSMEDRF